MEIKKYPEIDLDRYHNIFLEIGLVIALGVCFLAFGWKTRIKPPAEVGHVVTQNIETEMIPIVRQEEPVQAEAPPSPVIADVINIVSDDVDIENELVIEDTEADINTVIDVTPLTIAPAIKEEAEKEEDAQIFYVVEKMPEFPGGELALRKFLADAIQYPIIALENGIQGKVYVNFIVGKDGKVTSASVIRSVDPYLDAEALRVVNSLPRWSPGLQGGKPVRVMYSVPINFILQE